MTLTPEQLVYHYPSLPAVRVAKYAHGYWGERARAAVWSICQQLKMEVVKGTNLSWRKKKRAVAYFRWGRQHYYLFPCSGRV